MKLKLLTRIEFIINLTNLPHYSTRLNDYLSLMPSTLPLKKFTIRTHWQDFEYEFEEIAHEKLSKSIDCLSKFTSLEIFRLEFGIYGMNKTDILVKQIFDKFFNLRELHLINCVLNMTDDEMLEYIRAANRLNILDFTYSSRKGDEICDLQEKIDEIVEKRENRLPLVIDWWNDDEEA